jgi:hypothetical protein
MRGLSLTGALKQPGAKIRFASLDLSMHLRDMPAEKHMQQCLPCLFRPALIGRPDMQIAIDLLDFLRIKRSQWSLIN